MPCCFVIGLDGISLDFIALTTIWRHFAGCTAAKIFVRGCCVCFLLTAVPVRPRRHVGLLVCQVVQARDIRKMDAFGKADPFVELYTQPTAIQKTARAPFAAPCH